jgi:hypothetical protein
VDGPMPYRQWLLGQADAADADTEELSKRYLVRQRHSATGYATASWHAPCPCWPTGHRIGPPRWGGAGRRGQSGWLGL